jgi:1-acyl-sn-glycerol-3-phosphate acyltransferase
MSKHDTEVVGNSFAARAFYVFARTLVLSFLRVWTRMTVEGRHNMPKVGPFIIAPVHRSNLDTPIAGCAITRRPKYLAKDSMWKYAPIGWLVSALGGFPVDRGTADREALKRCIEVLDGGDPLVMFPEGGRRSGPVISELFDGAAYVASKTGVPILPVGIGGSERVMPKGAKFIYPRKLHVVFGELIPAPQPAEPGGRVPRAAVKETTQVLYDELQRLLTYANEYAAGQR